MELSHTTPYVFPISWRLDEDAQVKDIVRRRIERAPKRLKQSIPLLGKPHDILYLVENDLFGLHVIPNHTKNRAQSFIRDFGTLYPQLYSTSRISTQTSSWFSSASISVEGQFIGLDELELKHSYIYIASGSTVCMYRVRYHLAKPIRFEKRLDVPLSFFVRLGKEINHFNCLDWLEETIVFGIEGIARMRKAF
jgi:hypothetical protein